MSNASFAPVELVANALRTSIHTPMSSSKLPVVASVCVCLLKHSARIITDAAQTRQEIICHQG